MSRLVHLLVANRQRAPRGQAPRVHSAAGETTIYIYEHIVSTDAETEWWGGVSAQTLVPLLREQPAGQLVNLRINSPGGDVFAAQAIVRAMQDSPARIVAHVDGLAASAASVIMTAADEAVIGEGGMVMIHNAWTIAMGDANYMEATTAMLRKVDTSIAAGYERKTKKAAADLRAMMDAETWLTAEEALAQGFVDRLAADEPAAAQASVWDLSAYRNAPQAAAAAAEAAPPPAAPEAPPASNLEHDHRQRLATVLTRFKRAA